MTTRALERIENGERWNVSEVAHTLVERFDVEAERRPEERPDFAYAGLEWEIVNDADVPTVHEALRGKGRSLMSVEDATVSLAELENSLDRLGAFRDTLTGVIEEHGKSVSDQEVIWPLVLGLDRVFNGFFKDSSEVRQGYMKDQDGNNFSEVFNEWSTKYFWHWAGIEYEKMLERTGKKSAPNGNELSAGDTAKSANAMEAAKG